MQGDALPEGDDELRSLMSAILSGECAEEIYLDDVASICERKPQSAAALRALIGRYHRLGRMAAAQHQRIQETIELAMAQHGRRAPTARSDGYPFEDLTCDLSSEPVIGSSRTHVYPSQGPASQVTVRLAPPGRASVPAAAPPPVLTRAPAASTPITTASTPSTPSAASAASAGDADSGARVLHDRYELQQLLGRGGMASVYRAVDRYRAQLGLADCFVALKLVHANAAKPAGSEALGREFHSAQLLSHPNVVNVFDIDHDGDTIFYTMEMLSGERLSQVLRRLDRTVLPRPHALAIIRDIGAAVAHAHARGVVHADLKPSNVMITLDGEVRVLDFGGASMPPREPWVSEGDAEEAYLAATPAYASCEQLERRRADPRDDIYALACIIYLLLSGKHPFDQLSSIEARARGLRARRPPSMSYGQWRVLRHGLAWSRDQQPQSVEQWLAQLDLRGAAPHLPPLVALHTAVATPIRWGRMAAAVAPALLIAGIACWLVLGPDANWKRLSAELGAAPESAHVAGHTPPSGGAGSLASAQPTQPHSDMAPALAAAAAPAAQIAPLAAVPAAAATLKPNAPAADAAAAAVPISRAPVESSGAADAAAAPHVAFAYQNYSVAEGEPAARIVIQRVGNLQADLSFIWWTEPATAQPDVDYASFGRRVEHLPAGQDKLTVYVPIISSPVRAVSTQFHVAISDLGDGRTEGNPSSARATVTINRGG